MPNQVYTPTFPYNGDQATITSGRIIFHAKNDSIFLFGRDAIGLSSLGQVNIDSLEGTTINSPIIKLGLNAQDAGEPLVKGYQNNLLLAELIGELKNVCVNLSKISQTNLNQAIPGIINSTQQAIDSMTKLESFINTNSNLSKKTYTL